MIDVETSLLLERLEKRLEMLNGRQLPLVDIQSLWAEMGACILLIGRKVTEIERHQRMNEKDTPKKDSDLARTALVWFADKVLPSLVAALIVAAFGWFALVNGLLQSLPK